MAQLQSEITANSARPALEHLPELFSRLAEQSLRLLEAKLNLFTLEVKEDAAAFLRGIIALCGSALIAAVGVTLGSVGLAFYAATLFSYADERVNFALGFLVVGAIYLALGLIALLVARNRLSQRNVLPERSIEEFRKDQAWLTKDVL